MTSLERCPSFYFQYRCQHMLGHHGQHYTSGDDCTLYTWSSAGVVADPMERAMAAALNRTTADDGYNVTIDGRQPGGFIRPPVEKYVRTSIEFGGYTSEPAVEWRDGDDWAVMISHLEDIAHRVFVSHHPPRHQMDAARQLGAGMAQRWPGRAYFVEVWQEGKSGFAQIFQPFGVPRNR